MSPFFQDDSDEEPCVKTTPTQPKSKVKRLSDIEATDKAKKDRKKRKSQAPEDATNQFSSENLAQPSTHHR